MANTSFMSLVKSCFDETGRETRSRRGRLMFLEGGMETFRLAACTYCKQNQAIPINQVGVYRCQGCGASEFDMDQPVNEVEATAPLNRIGVSRR